MDFITDNQMMKNEIMQLKPIELHSASEIKSPKKTVENNKCSFLKGARKTLPSAKRNNSEAEITKSKSTNMDEIPNKINAAPECTSNVYDMRFPMAASTSNTRFIILENNTETSATRTLSAIINNDKDIKKETSLESIHGEKLNRNLLSQTKSNSLDSERDISRRRPLDNGNTLNIDSQKTFVNKCSLSEKYQCEKRGDRNPHFSSDGRNIGNYTFAKTGYLNQRFNRTLPLQSRENVNQDINKAVGNKLLQNFPNSRGMSRRQIKTVRFLDKENENSCKMQPHEVNAVRPNLTERQTPQILVSQNRNNSQTFTHGNILQSNQGNVFKFYLNKNNLPTANAENANNARPECYRPPPASFKNRNLLPIYPFQANSWQKGITGTATRNCDQNIRMIFPQQLEKQYNLVNNATAAHINISRPSFAVPKVETKTHGSNQSNKIVNGLDHILTTENNRKRTNSVNQIFTESGPANHDARSSEPHNFTNPDTDNSNSQNSAKKTRVADIKSTACQANDREARSEVEDKIQATNMMLSKISELLQNINKDLLCGFECPGLELSLPIWQAELEQCILSVEKIKTAITEYQDQKR